MPESNEFRPDLRRMAEAMQPRIEAAQTGAMGQSEINALLHELAVHQIELEMQNEQLQEAQRSLQAAKSKYYKLYKNLPIGYLTLDVLGIIVECNDHFLKLVNRPEKKVLGRTFPEFVNDLDRTQYSMWMKGKQSPENSTCVRLKTPDGSQQFVQIYRADLDGSPDEDQLSALTCMDVTALKVAEDRIRLSAAVFENSSEGAVVTDDNQKIILVNPAFTTITGYSRQEVIGKSPAFLKSGKHDAAFFQQFWQHLHAARHWQGQVWSKRKNGEIYPQWLTVNIIEDAFGQPLFYVGIFSDHTAIHQAAETIRQQANYDMLTGLPNRQLFMDRLEHAMRQALRTKTQVALLFLDLDGFKMVNDSLGHSAGDVLLQEVAARLLASVRETDTVARLGGDEFAIVLSNLGGSKKVGAIGNDILQKIAAAFHINKQAVYVSASIGISFYPQDAASAENLIKKADQAMYAAKNLGKNRVAYFTADMQQATEQQYRMLTDMRSADIAREFEVHYQPIVEISTLKIHKAEALIRWRHPKDGLLGPDRFVALAEESGMIVRLGEHVFQQVLRDLTQWRSQLATHLQVSINVSPIQFRDAQSSLANWIGQINASDDLCGGVVVEITEGLLMDIGPQVKQALFAFRDAGVQVALDDFGTGYSSLSYLKKYDIDFIKIDQSFVQNLSPDSSDLALCEAIVVMSHKLGIKVIAEGVETQLQCDLLRQIGCDFAQGYLFSKPVPRDVFEALVRSYASVSQ